MPTKLPHDHALIGAKLLSIMNQIDDAMDIFKSKLRLFDFISGSVFVLPRVTKEDENIPIDSIPVAEVSGEEALSLAERAYSQFYGSGDDSTKHVFRLPGVICLKENTSASNAELVDAVKRLNFLKKQFEETVDELKDRDSKFEVVHRAFPMLITLQVTRQIRVIELECRSVNFTWGSRSYIKKYTREELITKLEKVRLHPRNIDGEFTWSEMVDKDIQAIQSFNSKTQFRERRPLPSRPMVNLRYTQEAKGVTSSVKQQIEGSLPVIIVNPSPKFSTGKLKCFDINVPASKKLRNDRIVENEPIIPYLNMYVVAK